MNEAMRQPGGVAGGTKWKLSEPYRGILLQGLQGCQKGTSILFLDNF